MWILSFWIFPRDIRVHVDSYTSSHAVHLGGGWKADIFHHERWAHHSLHFPYRSRGTQTAVHCRQCSNSRIHGSWSPF
ncbi:hypothetical protein N7453_012091 [Penicillium expansum]|nr:hypothetical protein N7453_012091 [Penicillium expansum]